MVEHYLGKVGVSGSIPDLGSIELGAVVIVLRRVIYNERNWVDLKGPPVKRNKFLP